MTQATPNKRRSSRIPGFYERSLPDRVAAVAQWAGLDGADQATLLGMTGLSATQGDQMIENVIGIYALPLGIATNFLINDKDYLIPMVVEEPSVSTGVYWFPPADGAWTVTRLFCWSPTSTPA